MFFQQLVNGLTLGSAYAVIAIGYTLVFGVLNIVNMAHGGIFMIGAYIGLLLVTEAGLGIFPALIGAMIGGAVLGYGLEIFALRPLRRRGAGGPAHDGLPRALPLRVPLVLRQLGRAPRRRGRRLLVLREPHDAPHAPRARVRAAGDRKSTRLNSSHP